MNDDELRTIYSLRAEGGVVYIDFLKSDTDEAHNVRIAELIELDFQKVFSEQPGITFSVLVNLTPLHDRISYLSAATRTIYARVMDSERIAKVAIYGTNAFYEVAISFMVQMTHEREKIRLFKTETEARSWLGM